jgi:hypothetical protein
MNKLIFVAEVARIHHGYDRMGYHMGLVGI